MFVTVAVNDENSLCNSPRVISTFRTRPNEKSSRAVRGRVGGLGTEA